MFQFAKFQLCGGATRSVWKSEAQAASLSFWPQILGVAVSATLLRFIFGSRFLPLLAYGGMLPLAAGGALLLFEAFDSRSYLLAAIGLLGLGAGATVSPGLFLAGLSSDAFSRSSNLSARSPTLFSRRS